MTSGVVSNPVRKTCADVGDPKLVDEELTELVDPRRKLPDRCREAGIALFLGQIRIGVDDCATQEAEGATISS